MKAARIRRAIAMTTSIGVALMLAACQSPPAAIPSSPAVGSASNSSASPAGIALVALGDSGSTGHGDPSRKGWVGYYGELIEDGTGRAVEVENLAADGKTTEGLLSEVRSDAQIRAAIAHADVVVIGIGGNDLNEGDAALESGSCAGPACYDEPARRYRKNLGAIESEIQAIAAGRVLLLRAIGMPNSLTGAEELIPAFLRPIATKVGAHQAELFDHATCEVTESHGGACARLREAFNGPRGTKNAYAVGLMNLDDCCYPSEAGHRLIAKILYAAGLGSLANK